LRNSIAPSANASESSATLFEGGAQRSGVAEESPDETILCAKTIARAWQHSCGKTNEAAKLYAMAGVSEPKPGSFAGVESHRSLLAKDFTQRLHARWTTRRRMWC
jgi:hypothetical protein